MSDTLSRVRTARVAVPAHIYIDIPVLGEMTDEEIAAAAANLVHRAEAETGHSGFNLDCSVDLLAANAVCYPLRDARSGRVDEKNISVEDRH